MDHTSGDSMSPPKPTASYQSVSTSKAFPSTRLDTAPSEEPPAPEDISYLSSLRANVSRLQNDINAFLTQQMEGDKARDAVAATSVTQKRSKSEKDREREKREEEMYGEENMEEDA
ncbi:hypothetical protein LTR50_001903 [Elasticomyces elasticus]|nr:hypothetical protein LTR50_001903 [Elasticomyces elasticus]